MADETDVRFAVENMFPLRVRGREVSAYQPTWDVAVDDEPYRDYTLDLSHSAVSQSDALAMLDAMGPRLRHLHVADGTGLTKDEHLIPGRGNQPCVEVLERLAARGFDGHVIVEVNTRRALDRAEREADLAEALAFCRLHLVAAAVPAGERATMRREQSGGRDPRRPRIRPGAESVTRRRSRRRQRKTVTRCRDADSLAACCGPPSWPPSRNDRIERLVTAAPVSRGVVHRFVGGADTDAGGRGRAQVWSSTA